MTRAWSAGDLTPWVTSPDRSGIILDFDGTLAPIVVDPAAARPLEGIAEILEVLSARYRLVAVVSGRPGVWLATQLPVPGLDRWGSYGLEHVVDGRVEVSPEAERWMPAVAAVTARARAEAPAGVLVEDKGISVTLHVRRAPQHASWARQFAEREATASGLSVHDAKMSVELRPPLEVDKGAVVARLVTEHGLSAACFVGDDIGDLTAFRALGAVPTALRVAVRSAESPPALVAAADVVVDGPGEVLELLRAFVGGS